MAQTRIFPWGHKKIQRCVQEAMAGSPLTMGGLKGTVVVALNLGVVENLWKNHGKPMENHGKTMEKT